MSYIKSCLEYRLNNSFKTYNFTTLGLSKFIALRPRSQQLLFDMLRLLESGYGLGSIRVVGLYSDFGFSRANKFYCYRKELVDAHFISVEPDGYYINPTLVDYLTNAQLNYLYRKYNLKKSPIVNFGQLDK